MKRTFATCHLTMKKLYQKLAAVAPRRTARPENGVPTSRLLTTVPAGAFAWHSIAVRPSARTTRWIE